MGITDDAHPGTARRVKSLIQATQPAMANDRRNTRNPMIATKRSGAVENELTPSSDRFTIFARLYLELPARRVFRS